MKKKTVSGLLLALFLLGMLTLVFNVQPVRASGTIYIRPDGSVEGTDKIHRDGDVYTFIDNINDEIVVEIDNIVVDGAGYTLQGTWPIIVVGIDLTGRTNVTIKNTVVKSLHCGILLSGSSNYNSISGNNITNCDIGISLSGSSNYNSVSANNIANSIDGINAYECSYNSISGNNILNYEMGITLWSSNYNNISGNNIKAKLGMGIALWSSSYNSVSGNNIKSSSWGIDIRGSSNSVTGNNITNNFSGITLEYSNYNNISGNNITNNDSGISLGSASNNTISGNNMKSNLICIGIRGSSNSVTGNNITDNLDGISLISASNNTISGNNMTNNYYGVHLFRSSNNIIYHNNFVNNILGQVDSYESTNVWDDGYPSGGNYWSDHITVDDYSGVGQNKPGSDGVVDEPYIIDDYNRDNYPLVEPWSPGPPRPQEDLEELIGTIVSWNLPEGTENSFTSKLEEAILLLNKGNENGAIHKLMDLINEVEALRDTGKLEDWQTDYLITETQRIIDLING